MISVNRNKYYGNDLHCKILMDGESTITSSKFINKAYGRKGNNDFFIIGADGQYPTKNSLSKFGNNSFYFNDVPITTVRGIGLSGYTSTGTPVYDDWNFGNGDFCIDMNIRFSDNSSYAPIMAIIQNSNNYHTIKVVSNTIGKSSLYLYWNIFIGGVNIINISRLDDIRYSLNKWYHVAFVREKIGTNDNYTIYGDGFYLTGATNNFITNIPNFSDTLYIGIDNQYTVVNMYIDNFRISKGNSRWRSYGNTIRNNLDIPKTGY